MKKFFKKVHGIFLCICVLFSSISPYIAYAAVNERPASAEKGSIYNPVTGEVGDSATITAGSLSEKGDVQVTKTVTKKNNDGLYTVTLDVQGKNNSTSSTVAKDSYTVFVLDASYSMSCIMGGGSACGPGVSLRNENTPWDKAKAAAISFSTAFVTKSDKNKIALVTFNGNGYQKRAFENTAFDENDFGSTGSSTDYGDGLRAAKSYFDDLTAKDKENAVLNIIFISDGEPNGGSYSNVLAELKQSVNIYSFAYNLTQESNRNAYNKLLEVSTNNSVTSITSANIDSILRTFVDEVSVPTAAAENATVTDKVGEGFNVVTKSNDYTITGDEVKYKIDTIEEGKHYTITFDIQINRDLPTGWYDTNDGFNITYDGLEVPISSDQNPSVYWVQQEYDYVINYYHDSISQDNFIDDVTGIAPAGTNIEADTTLYLPTGYKFEGTAPSMTIENGSNILNVVYVKDEEQTKPLKYTVKYFKDGQEVVNDTYDVEENVWVNDPNTLEVRDIDTKDNKYVGYVFSHTNPEEIPDTIATGSTIEVHYIKDENQTKELNYSVKYFKDNVEVKEDGYTETEEVWVNASDMIVVKTVDTSNGKYLGYKLSHTAPTPIPNSIVTGSIIEVHYEKDESQTKDLSYTVKYFQDGVEVEADTYEVEENVWVNDPNTLEVQDIDTANDRYVGYKFSHTNPAEIPETTVTGSTIEVYYVKDEKQTKDLSYTVKYFQDGVEVEEDTYEVEKNVWVNDSNTLEVEEIDTANDKYVGYKFSHTNPEEIPETIVTGSTIEVHYVKDEKQTKDLSYTVKYFQDGVEVEEDTYEVEKTVWVNDSNTLEVEEIDTANNRYVGYKFSHTTPEELPKTTVDGSVIEVHYEKDEKQTKDLSYTVKYFKDGAEVIVDTYTINEIVWINEDDMLAVRDIDTANDKYVGYKFSHTNPAEIPSEVETGSVIEIHYVTDNKQTKELKYNVKYYKDGVEVTQDGYTETEEVWINASDMIVVKTIDQSNEKYLGYKFSHTNPETIPSEVETGTTIEVHYEKDESQTKDLSYTVKYFKDGVEVTQDGYIVKETVWVNEDDMLAVGDIDTANDKYVGYKFSHTNPEEIPAEVETGSTIEVHYVKDEKQTKDLSYTVKYFQDGVEVEEDTYEVEKTVWVNDSNTLEVEEIDTENDKYVGYKFSHTNPAEIPSEVETGSTIEVHYEKDESQTKDLSYTVKYFKDGVEVEVDGYTKTEEVWINEDDMLEVEEIDTANDKYVGYKFSHTNPAEIPSEVETGSTIEVHYVKDEEQTKDLSYTVKYFKDGVEVEVDGYTETEEVWINEDDMLEVEEIDKSNDKYVGYKFSHTNPETIPSEVETGTTIEVHYIKDENQTKILKYSVKYFIDGEEIIEDGYTETEKVWINASDMLVVKTIDKANDKYVGYKFSHTNPEEIPENIETDSIIEIHYEKDENQTKELSYTVNYYVDGKLQEEDTITVTEEVWINAEDTLTVKEIDTSDDKYKGHSFAYTDPENLPEVIEDGSVINVYYEKNIYKYTIEYYYNQELDASKTENLEAYYGDVIETYPDKIMEDYELEKVENLPLTIDVEENVIKVYYIITGVGNVEPPHTGTNNNIIYTFLGLNLITSALYILKKKEN